MVAEFSDTGLLDRVVQIVELRGAEIAEQWVCDLQRAGSPLVWDSVMLHQLRLQAALVLEDTVARLGGNGAGTDGPDMASVQVGVHSARHGFHTAESLRAADLLFGTALTAIADDLRASTESAEEITRLSIALHESISRRVILTAKAYFATWLDQVRNTQDEPRLRIMQELSEASREQLVGAIHSVMRDPGQQTTRSPEHRSGEPVHLPDGDDRAVLTPREQEVLELAAQAMTTRQIAETLYIAEGTVRHHLGNSYKKLDAAGRLDAVNRAIAAGLIHPATQSQPAMVVHLPLSRRER